MTLTTEIEIQVLTSDEKWDITYKSTGIATGLDVEVKGKENN